ncbi:App1 family protein [Spirosoma foliorum]|uniref:App1 family protein n=1 Tax=Spirosoma foliorum TaxID=2710596 RepID=UPI001F0AC35B|nr:phosphatase domain-containing protein [Spirosoma foliorum]
MKIYRGFGNGKTLIVHGSMLRRSALPRTKYRTSIWLNLLGLIRLFLVRPYPHATMRIQAGGQTIYTQADLDGYFRAEVPVVEPLPSGWHVVQVQCVAQESGEETVVAEGKGAILIPHQAGFACISDIDDTFLVSHSATLLKRLRVLLTRNAHTRQPFEGVVAHYKLLAEANRTDGQTNPFFYVSSSEWNLYDYIVEFSKKNGLPEGVYLLSPLKQLAEVLKTGQGKHMTKFMRIVRILEAYPEQRFILLGDDTQEDPTIYESVVRHFQARIRCVYIRQVYHKNQPKTREILSHVEAMGVPCCYFAHSAEARQHSVESGLTTL